MFRIGRLFDTTSYNRDSYSNYNSYDSGYECDYECREHDYNGRGDRALVRAMWWRRLDWRNCL
jgi:hypothetical protein